MIQARFIDRLVGMSALSVMLFASYVLVMSPLSDWRSGTLSNYGSQDAEMKRLSRVVEKLSLEKGTFVATDLAGLLWDGQQIAETTARIQSAINELAKDSSIILRSISPTSTADPIFESAIGFRVEFEADLEDLTSFLMALEYGQPALLVSRINLRRLARPGQVDTQPKVFAQVDLIAPMRLISEPDE